MRFGADAVYFACDRFGLRQRASNFALDDVPAAVACAHAAGSKAYAAVNALMDADDLAALPAYLEALDEAQVDALIVSDLGAFSLARKHAPHVELHVSTQAGVMNAEAARMWHELGASRVVCAREMSVADIARMRADAPRELELEAFVHGAMCMAVSGRCLLSSAMAGRSGNKGHCAQPCRWSYALVEEQRPGEFYPVEEDVRGTYVMNAQDLNMLAHLDDLVAAGVDSLKIEGRNKKAFYVATVVHAYRAVLDGADPAVVAPELLTISHRPYSTGFYYGRAEQTPERDGYVKECLHAATVTACEPSGAAAWRVEAVCHNRFCEGDQLEALSPRRPVSQVQVRNLAWLPKADELDPAPAPVPVAVANRSAERYAFEADASLAPGDYLRIRIS
nr:U32 family peptidase [Arabiibacter massiliensis]